MLFSFIPDFFIAFAEILDFPSSVGAENHVGPGKVGLSSIGDHLVDGTDCLPCIPFQVKSSVSEGSACLNRVEPAVGDGCKEHSRVSVERLPDVCSVPSCDPIILSVGVGKEDCVHYWVVRPGGRLFVPVSFEKHLMTFFDPVEEAFQCGWIDSGEIIHTFES